MFWLSLLLAPSDPSATAAPERSSAGTGATPAPSLRLLTGLCTATASDAENPAISSSLSQIAWAKDAQGPRQPIRSRNSTVGVP